MNCPSGCRRKLQKAVGVVQEHEVGSMEAAVAQHLEAVREREEVAELDEVQERVVRREFGATVLGAGRLEERARWELEHQATIEPREGRRMHVGIQATPSAAFSDERPIPAFVRSAAPLVVGAVALALALKVAFVLAARSVADPLAHPVRRSLYEQILVDPGIAYRELMRDAGIGNGQLAHHIRVLARSGLIVDQEAGSRRHFFENHGRYSRTWQVVAALRDESCRALFEWLRSNPNANQLAVLEFAKTFGWSRSGTQKRLNRLIAQRLVHRTREGRAVSYRAIIIPGVSGP